jgi:hypothetical protein
MPSAASRSKSSAIAPDDVRPGDPSAASGFAAVDHRRLRLIDASVDNSRFRSERIELGE